MFERRTYNVFISKLAQNSPLVGIETQGCRVQKIMSQAKDRELTRCVRMNSDYNLGISINLIVIWNSSAPEAGFAGASGNGARTT